jgi:hypothetical protein
MILIHEALKIDQLFRGELELGGGGRSACRARRSTS